MKRLMQNQGIPAVSLHRLGAAVLLSVLSASSARRNRRPLPNASSWRGSPRGGSSPAPYDLAGKRVVFTSWYDIQPGDLDWRNAEGKSVYVSGDEGPFGARHVGIDAPHGIRIVAEKPQVMGPLNRPHRMVLRDGDVYKGWTDSDYYESHNAIHWQKKAALKLGAAAEDGVYQVFIDPSAPSEQRYKAVWVGQIARAKFDAFRPTARRLGAACAPGAGREGRGDLLRGGTSPDGIRWTTLPDPLVVEYCDTWNTAYFDPELREYVIYTRQWSIGPRTDRLPPDIRNSWTGVGRRAIGRTASHDFRRFRRRR